MSNIDISVVVPIYNEEDVLPHLVERLLAVMEKLVLPYDIIFVNDGSADKSLDLLIAYAKTNPQIKILSFSRNFGQQAAFTAGLNFAKGKAVVTIDGDLQDPPEIIPKFLAYWQQGYKVIYGIRKNRKEGLIKKSLYWLYYRLLQMLSNIEMPLDSGDCALMDREIVKILNSMPERNRFVRGLRSWVGFKQIGLEYERDKRYGGRTKYTFLKLFKLGMDGIVSFAEVPLKISITLGVFVSLFSITYALYIAFYRIFVKDNSIPGWASIVVGITFLGGCQLLIMGFMGEYLIRTIDEVKRRPQYILNAVIGFENQNATDIGYNTGL